MILQLHARRILFLVMIGLCSLMIFFMFSKAYDSGDPEVFRPKKAGLSPGVNWPPHHHSPSQLYLFDLEKVDNAPERWPKARDVPDTRSPLCQGQAYHRALPKASIVMCFRNESALLLERTVHTIFRRTPDELLDEVILVDDNGDLDSLDSFSQNNDQMKQV